MLVAVPPLLPKYALEVLISILFFAISAHAGIFWAATAGSSRSATPPSSASGAYTSTLLFLQLGVTPWLGMIAGGVLAAAFGLFAGYLSFRYGLRGPYFIGDTGFRRNASGRRGELEGGGLLLGLRGAEPGLGAAAVPLRGKLPVLLRHPLDGAGGPPDLPGDRALAHGPRAGRDPRERGRAEVSA
jgi:hypothetical protein